jgi:hypothetical protein
LIDEELTRCPPCMSGKFRPAHSTKQKIHSST